MGTKFFDRKSAQVPFSNTRPVRTVSTLWISIFALSCCCQANGQEIQEGRVFAKPVHIVPPPIPDVSATVFPIELKMSGTVTADGKLNSPEFEQSEGKEAFVRAVLDVLPTWRFRPVLDVDACTAKQSQASLTVYFELKDGKPTFFISSPVRAKDSDQDRVSFLEVTKLSPPPLPLYPRSMIQRQIEGYTEILMQVDKVGDVIKADIVMSVPVIDFGESARTVFRRAKFPKNESGESERFPGSAACHLVPVSFCLEFDPPPIHADVNCAGNQKSGIQVVGRIVPSRRY